MEFKTLYRDDGEFAIVEVDSQADQDFTAAGWTAKEPKAKTKAPKVVTDASI